MNKRILKIWVILVVGMTGIGTAQGKSVETFHEEFRLNTGKEWIDATAEEKRSFVQDYYHTKEETARKGKARLYYGGDEGGSEPSLSIESTLEIQRLFKKKKKKSWEEATSEEQKTFLAEYEKKYQEELERQRMKEEKIAQNEEKRRQLKEQEKEKLKRLTEQEALKELREKERREQEREKSREKLMDALEKLQRKRSWNPNSRERK